MKIHAKINTNFPGLDSVTNARHVSFIWTKLTLVFADLASMIVAIWLAHRVFKMLNLAWKVSGYSVLETTMIVFLSTYVLVGYYRSRNVNQVEELQHLTITTSIIFLTLLFFNTLMENSKYPPGVLGLSWLFTMATVPLARVVVRSIGSKIGIWGEPVVIIGNGKLSRKIVNYLLKNTYCGLKPVLVLDGLEQDVVGPAETRFPIPVTSVGTWPANTERKQAAWINTAIIVTPDLPTSMSEAIARGEHLGFSNIITVTNRFNTRNFGLTPLDFGGILGFEERHYELDVFEDRLIRIFDLCMILISLPILAPVVLAMMIAIKLDSNGSIFYRHTRIGKGGRTFRVLKFRTMVANADKVLKKYLEENPSLLAEWQADHKLRNDPRITRVGKILRKTSLDELPQLWNVLKGEMSLIGPRPIVNEEIGHYGDRFRYYEQVPPGISGLWQVSGRNDTGYEERVSLDEYYVRNRSIWLNLHILIRTFLAVIKRQGAY